MVRPSVSKSERLIFALLPFSESANLVFDKTIGQPIMNVHLCPSRHLKLLPRVRQAPVASFLPFAMIFDEF